MYMGMCWRCGGSAEALLVICPSGSSGRRLEDEASNIQSSRTAHVYFLLFTWLFGWFLPCSFCMNWRPIIHSHPAVRRALLCSRHDRTQQFRTPPAEITGLPGAWYLTCVYIRPSRIIPFLSPIMNVFEQQNRFAAPYP